MTSMLPNKGTSIVQVKPKMDKPKIPSDLTKDESRSFLSFSRENLSISHSDLEQGFNKMRPRLRRDTILSLIAIFLALFCIGLEIWKIQSVVDNAKEIEILKHDIETMQHRLLEEDLLDELKAFEEMYAEEDSEDDDTDDSDVDSGDYDSAYGDDEEENDHDHDEESKLSQQEYLGDYHSAPYSTHGSGSSDAAAVNREDDLGGVLAALQMAEVKSVRENRKKIELERLLDEEKLSDHEQPENRKEEEDKEDLTEEFSEDPDPSTIKRKRSVEKEQPVGYNPSGVPIYTHGYFLRNRKNSTRNFTAPRLSLYENLMNEEKVTTEKSKEESLIHHAVVTSWDKYPPKKYYAQSRAATSHVRPPPLYASKVHNPRQINGRRSGGWRDEGPQALMRKEETVNRREAENLRAGQDTRPLRRRGMARRHLRGQRQVVAAHFGADSTLFTAEDEHVENGKGRHHQGIFKAWRPSSWMDELGMSRHFALSTGELTVQEGGLYLIYAQIHYLDQSDENGFRVLVNGNSILQCMVYSPGSEHKSRSCFSAQAAFLQSGDRLSIKDVGIDKYTLFQQDKSFFGLVRLGDTRLPRQPQQN